MTSILAKSLLGLSALTVAATGGVFVYLNYRTKKVAPKEEPQIKSESKKRKISELLKGKKIVGDENSGKWAEKWNGFVNAHNSQNPSGDWLINDWTNKKAENKGLDDFKNLCKENFEKEADSETDPLFIKVNEYCIE